MKSLRPISDREAILGIIEKSQCVFVKYIGPLERSISMVVGALSKGFTTSILY